MISPNSELLNGEGPECVVRRDDDRDACAPSASRTMVQRNGLRPTQGLLEVGGCVAEAAGAPRGDPAAWRMSSSAGLGAGAAVIGRLPNDSPQRAITLSQNGIVHRWRWVDDGSEQDMLVLGAGASVSFSGPRLAAVLREATSAQVDAVERLAAGDPHAPLSLHTSAGGTPEMGPFVDALRPHLPWPEARTGDDGFVNLQTEGTSAVFAAVDICLQQAARDDGCGAPDKSPRRKVAVGAYSYHGPGSSSFGAAAPLGDSFGPKADQLIYPVPAARDMLPSETEADFHERTLAAFEAFLETHGHQIAVMLVEPQWGSSLAAQPWPADLLRSFIGLARKRSIYIVCDEIMCGLGRHGAGKLFLSEAWGLEPDVVTFGKSIGGSIFPLAGAVVRRGRRAFFSRDPDVGATQERGPRAAHLAVLQSHTYAGASGLALMVARATLASVSDVFDNVAKRGEQIALTMRFAMRTASAGMLRCHGQGLLWGAEWKLSSPEQAEAANEALVAACRAAGVWPYFVKGGFMVTPVLDVDEASLAVALERLVEAVRAVARSMWQIRALGQRTPRATGLAVRPGAGPTRQGEAGTGDDSTGVIMASAL